MRIALAVLLAGCIGSEQSEEGAPTAGSVDPATLDPDQLDPERFGWVWQVASHPELFEQQISPAKGGWVALHANQLNQAIGGFEPDPIGRARAEIALSVLYADLAVLSGQATEMLFSAWEARGNLPAGPEVPLTAALAAHCSDGESAGAWAGRVEKGPDVGVAQALTQGRSPFGASSNGPFGRRMGIHQQSKTSGDPGPLLQAATTPIASIEETDFVREFWDPCIYRTLADLWRDQAIRDAASAASSAARGNEPQIDGGPWRSLDRMVTGTGLGAVLFAPWPTASDLRADLKTAGSLGLVGANAPSLRRFGVGTATFPGDDPEAAKEEVRLLDAGLDALQARITDQASAEGIAVVNDLGLIHRFRQEWLVVRARRALAEKRPRSAMTLLELSRDHAEREIGARNSPSLFALLALARLQMGHTREALDALYVLSKAHPEVKGIAEVTGELAILQGLDRNSDIKEE